MKLNARSIRILQVLFAGTLCLALYILMAGPHFPLRPVPTPAIVHDVNAAANLDQYLAQHEAAVADVKPDLRKGIVWYSSSEEHRHEKTPIAFVYLHGFSASRAEISPVMEKLAERFQANVFYTRLTAHGLKDGEAFAQVRAQDWLNDAREALAIGRRIGERVVLVGTSTGGTLAVDLAYENLHEADIAGVVLISPNFRPSDWRSKYISGPLGPWLAKTFIGDYYHFKPDNAKHGELWTSRYRSEGIAQMMDLVNYTDELDLKRLQVPILVLYTHHDTVVNLDLLRSKFAEMGSVNKKLIDLPEASRHEFAGDALAPKAVGATVNTIARFVSALKDR